ncbi:unnamed protein product [Parnassius apollo]|uniref:(apollo) hypothetical protein n=1 Tax=Parnassius apollo TaxID=110799 RepID=A0A8S3WNX3_PARAO|nr:unnamed protein product [Parnassius apollo]
MACTGTETGGIANENSPYHRMPTSASILEGLNSITTIANNIITTISAGRSVTSDSKKAIIEMAHDINRIIRETQIKTEYTASIIEVKESLQNTIKEEISKLSIRTQTKSYASVASTPRPPPSNPAPTHASKPAIIVTPTNKVNSRQEVIESWRKSICFKSCNYAPSKLQVISNNKLRVEFDTCSQRDDALERLKSATTVNAEAARKINPMVILKGLSNDVPSEELVSIITGQNDELRDLINNTDDALCLRFKRKNKNPKLYNAVFLCNPTIWRKIMDSGRINVDHQRIHVENFCPFIQCFSCLQFGHVQGKCTNNIHPCSHCAAGNHTYTNCPNKANKSATTCYNCQMHNNKFNTKFDTQHAATSFSCPRVKGMKERINQRIDYGSNK